jgi:16S rRNA (guanine(966)-N(2))-methyltransferase RsmD
MRVIAGEFRSRRLKSVPGLDTRPTPDRLRETLFNILATRLPGKTFLDAYAGTGAVGIEALSRGAARAIFIERSRAAIAVLKENLSTLGIRGRAEILEGRTLQYLPVREADIVFLDPPYDLTEEYAPALDAAGDAPLVIAQHDSRTELPELTGKLVRTRTIKQGDNSLSFYEILNTIND